MAGGSMTAIGRTRSTLSWSGLNVVLLANGCRWHSLIRTPLAVACCRIYSNRRDNTRRRSKQKLKWLGHPFVLFKHRKRKVNEVSVNGTLERSAMLLRLPALC